MAAILGIGGLEKDVLIIKLFKIYYEMKDFKKLYENIVKSEWFKKAYHNKRLGDCPFVIDELEESEDEKIRKELIGALMWQRDCLDAKGPHDNNLILPGFTMKVGDILAWLEKQKEQKPAEWSEKFIADVFEKVGLAKIVREQGNDGLTNALQAAMIELSKVENTEWSDEDKEKLERVDDLLWMLDDYLGDDCSICEERTARLRDEIQKELCPWLNSLPERSNLQSKEEWSKEETKDLVHILKVLDDCYAYGKHDLSKTDHDNLTNRIKFLRPSWKPNEKEEKE